MANIINVNQKRFKHRKLVVTLAVVCIVLVGAGAYVYVTPGLLDGLLGRQSLQSQIDKATTLASQGKSSQAVTVLQQYINNSSTSTQDKRSAYLQQGVLLTGQSQIDALIKADQLAPWAATEGTIAQKAELIGNKSVAIEYYKKAISNANDGSDMPDSITFYKNRLKALTNAQ